MKSKRRGFQGCIRDDAEESTDEEPGKMTGAEDYVLAAVLPQQHCLIHVMVLVVFIIKGDDKWRWHLVAVEISRSRRTCKSIVRY